MITLVFAIIFTKKKDKWEGKRGTVRCDGRRDGRTDSGASKLHPRWGLPAPEPLRPSVRPSHPTTSAFSSIFSSKKQKHIQYLSVSA
jgi:hypothetical protein